MTRQRTFFLIGIAIVILVACTPSRPLEVISTVTTTGTPIPLPNAIDLGILGKGSAVDMEWSPDGTMLVVESTAGGFIYDTENWELITSIPTDLLYDNRLSKLTFFPDNENLLFAAAEVTDNVYHTYYWRYNLRTGVVSRAFENISEAPYQKPLFSPDGKFLVIKTSICTSSDTDLMCREVLELYDTYTGDLVRRIPENGLDQWENMSVFAFSPDSRLIVTGGTDNVVRMWDVSDGTLTFELQHESDVNSLSFNPDGSVLVSAGNDAAVRFWDVEKGESLYTLHGTLEECFQNAAIIDDGKTLLVNYYDGKFKEYSLNEQYLPVAPLDVRIETEKRFPKQWGSGNYAPDLVIRFSPDGRTMALLVNSSVQIWDLQTGEKTLTLPEFNRDIFSMEFSPDGKLLAMGDHNVRLWQVSSRKFIGTLEINGNQITDIAFSPDNKKIAFASTVKDAEVWNITKRQKILTLETECRPSYLAYSPDGDKLATAGQCGIELFDTDTGVLQDKFPNDMGTPAAISFNEDGSLLFYISGNGRRAWNLTTGRQIYSTKRIGDYMGNVALRPNLLAITKSWKVPIYFFDPASGKRLYEFPPGEGSNGIALSPDGRLLALDNYNKISLLDSVSGAELLSMKFRLPYTMAFSPNNNLLAARNYQETAHLWDVSNVAKYTNQIPPQTATPNLTLTPTAQPTATPAPTLVISVPTSSSLVSEDQGERVAKIEKLGELGMGRMRVMTWAPDGKSFALGGYAGAYIFEFGSPHPTDFFPSDNVIILLAFSSDGNYLAGQISNYEIDVWDVSTGNRLQKFENIYCWNQGMVFSPDHKLLTADCGETVYTLSISSGEVVSKETREIDDTSPSEKYAVQTGMKSARLIDAETSEIVKTFEIPGMAPSLSIFSPDRKTLAVWHYQYEIARTGVYYPGQELKTILQLWNIFPDRPPSLRAELPTGRWYQSSIILEGFQGISFTPDSRKLATSSGDGNTQVWDVDSGELLYTLPEGNNIYFSPDGKHLASVDNDGARVWDISSSQPARIWEISGFNRYSFSLAFAKNGTELVSITDEYAKFFPVSNSSIKEPTRQIKLPGVRGHNMSVSPDGSWLAYNTAKEILIGENSSDETNWKTLSKFPEPLTYNHDFNLTFSPDSSLLASFELDRTIRLWNLDDFTYLELALEPGAFISEFLFSPDGTLLLGAYPQTSDPSTFFLWDTRTGKLVRQWTSQVYQLAFHTHQPILIGVDYMTGIVRFFDLRTGDVIKEIRADQYVQEIAFSPAGSLLALGYDEKFEIRDAETLVLLKEIPIGVSFLTFSPDGSKIAVALTDGRIQYWGLSAEEE